jgi:hypothetical protein
VAHIGAGQNQPPEDEDVSGLAVIPVRNVAGLLAKAAEWLDRIVYQEHSVPGYYPDPRRLPLPAVRGVIQAEGRRTRLTRQRG